MTDLAQIITAAVEETISEDFIKTEVTKRIEKLAADVINQELHSYGDIGKKISKAVKDSLEIGSLDIPSYGQVVNQMLKAQIEKIVTPLVAGRLAEDMEGLLKLAPKTVKLSKIVEDMLENSLAYQDGEFGDLVTCIVEHTEYTSTWLYLDDREHYDERDKYKCSLRILLKKDGTISSGSWDSRDFTGRGQDRLKNSVEFGRTYGIGELFQAYYACGTVIEIDEDCVSTYHDYD